MMCILYMSSYNSIEVYSEVYSNSYDYNSKLYFLF